MLGFKFIKADPTTYLMAFRNGRVVREGAGLSQFYYAPTTNLVAVPIASREQPFIFEKLTADFQTITIQGQVSFRIAEPQKTATMLNFGVKADGRTYESEDPQKLPLRIVAQSKCSCRGSFRSCSSPRRFWVLDGLLKEFRQG